MKNLLMILILTFMGGELLLAKSDWKQGYLIYQNGDTIYGEIKYDEGKKSSSKCTFRKDKTSDNQTLTTEVISGYRFVEGKFFVSRDIKELNLESPIFLEYLIEGKVSLYRYNTGTTNDDRYFAEKEGAYYELKNTTEIRQTKDNPNGYYFNKKEYVGTLNVLFQDANMSNEISKSGYRPNSLIKLTKTYHETVCTDQQCIIFERTTKPMYVKYGLLVGVSNNQFDFGKTLLTDYQLGYNFGCRFEFKNILDLYEKFSVTIDLNLQKYNTYTIDASPEIEANYGKLDYYGKTYYVYQNGRNPAEQPMAVDMDILALKIPIILNHTFTTSAFQPYIGGGLFNVFTLSQNDNLQINNFYQNYGQSIPTYQIGLIGKLGFSIVLQNQKSIFIEGVMEYSRSPRVGEPFVMTNKSFNLTCGFLF